MTQVQNGGVSETPKTDIKNEAVQNRPIMNPPFAFDSEDIEDKHIFKTMMSPGKFHFMSSKIGTGKTHLMVNLMYLLTQGFDGCGDWDVITNVFFYRKGENGVKVCTPEHVHHIDRFEEFIDKLVELSNTGRKIALFLDDLNRFYVEGGKDALSTNLRKLVINRRKLKILLFFCDTRDLDEFDNSVRNRPHQADYLWSRYKSKQEWEDTKVETHLALDWEYLDANYFFCPDETSGHIRTSISEWTNSKKIAGWFYDRGSDASVLRLSQSSTYDSFWMGLENVSSLSVKAYIRKYTSSTSEEEIKKNEQTQREKNIVELAVKMKSIGLTDEAIECVLETPKTTLRRWAEKAGHRWKVGEIDLPYRFKSTREAGRS